MRIRLIASSSPLSCSPLGLLASCGFSQSVDQNEREVPQHKLASGQRARHTDAVAPLAAFGSPHHGANVFDRRRQAVARAEYTRRMASCSVSSGGGGQAGAPVSLP